MLGLGRLVGPPAGRQGNIRRSGRSCQMGRRRLDSEFLDYIGLATLLPGYPMKRLLCISMLAIACGTMAQLHRCRSRKVYGHVLEISTCQRASCNAQCSERWPGACRTMFRNDTLTLYIYNCFCSPFPASYRGYEVVTLRVDSALSLIRRHSTPSTDHSAIDSVKLAATALADRAHLLTLTLDRT